MRLLPIILLFVSVLVFADECKHMLPYGKPVTAVTDVTYICRSMYVLEHSPTKKSALWVAELVTHVNFVGSEKRTDKFLADPELSIKERANPSDYARSGFDRGHLAPAGNMDSDPVALEESFYLSNIVPQHPENNRNGWRHLEEHVRNLVQTNGDLYVITGPIYLDDKTIGKGKVGVPTHLFKIVLDKDENVLLVILTKNIPISKSDLPALVVPLELVEELTGIRFFPEANYNKLKRSVTFK